ncbi:YQGE family putative transporter [Gracilibacillus halotolerans]|uniref:YQGE family putative transporter n=1 Tax=Gracilibacillus halotolerans TaxID=74386 RepID=A0A841RIU7_9BACI|nr:MFS transporter [Gracilibacillus halotolerans]MBB6511797.1 YQGE family putative transporter [Gracilibacillus halotolerans]
MIRWKGLNTNRDLKVLLMIGGLFAFATFLSNTFVNVFLWKQSNDYLNIAIYNLFVSIFSPLSFLLAGRFSKMVDRTIIIRFGMGFLMGFYLIILFLGDHTSSYPFIIGAILGIGNGFYWMSFNLLTFEVTEPDTRDYFNGILGSLQSFGGMAGPFIAGYIVSLWDNFKGYSIIFFISFVFFLVAAALSFLLHKRHVTGRLYLKDVIQERIANKNWRHILYAHTFQGSREGLFAFIITIWIYVATSSEFAIGTFNLLLSLSSFIGYYIVSKFLKDTLRKKYIFYGGLFLYLSVWLFVFQTETWMLFLYGVLAGLAYPVYNVPFISLTYDIIGTAKKARELRVEYVILREIFLNIGRIAAIVIFIISIQFMDPISSIPILLLSLGAGNLIASLFVKKIEHPLIKNSQ